MKKRLLRPESKSSNVNLHNVTTRRSHEEKAAKFHFIRNSWVSSKYCRKEVIHRFLMNAVWQFLVEDWDLGPCWNFWQSSHHSEENCQEYKQEKNFLSFRYFSDKFDAVNIWCIIFSRKLPARLLSNIMLCYVLPLRPNLLSKKAAIVWRQCGSPSRGKCCQGFCMVSVLYFSQNVGLSNPALEREQLNLLHVRSSRYRTILIKTQFFWTDECFGLFPASIQFLVSTASAP